ncbi:B-box zinc finger protein 20-like [Chenopodium quinoa]|uniref:B box-type domain-containing protein n=1 Tax=Chenopodium quinoa TaxID=63459 RepID=A0A803LKD9_CHEQI|nr:B-box zinc finger protein 20-like [Chenopodium quinoa]
MKIQCDVCSKKEASVFCSADEAALCDVCDHKVHHANKLASKHHRFSLLHPSTSSFPLCDICQEKRALIFCQQDRAILCRECELPLHTANEHTEKHNRFLLTGIKLSAVISDNTKSTDTVTASKGIGGYIVPDFKSAKKPTSVSSEKTLNSSASLVTNSNSNSSPDSSNNNQLNCGGSTSNISEYLIDMLPGWHFEDLLVDSAAPFGFSKNTCNNQLGIEVNEDVLSFFDVENEKELTSSSTNSENFWVPQAAITSNMFGQTTSELHQITNASIYGTKKQQQSQQTSVTATMKLNIKYLKDDAFTVPQIITNNNSSLGSKRTRPSW